MPILFTRSGDDGSTGLLGEGRVPKYHPRVEALGAIDETTAALGLARAACQSEFSRPVLLQAQRDLYGLMAEVSATPDHASQFRTIDAGRVVWLEAQVEAASTMVEIPDEFIVPGDSPAGAALDLARTVVRRAERRLVYLSQMEGLENAELLRYLNRLSSLCFILELLENRAAGKEKTSRARGDEP